MYNVKEIYYTFQGEGAYSQEDQVFFADFLDVIYGQVEKKIEKKQNVIFVTLIFLERTE